MAEDWLNRWEEGRTGWHEAAGNAGLKQFWPATPPGTRVLVPLCGKSQDLLWLENSGCSVTGVELSAVAIDAFFLQNDLQFETQRAGPLTVYRARDKDITLICGDYFEFDAEPFDALYDRGALTALPPDVRPLYVRHTNKLLKNPGPRLVITLEYDQSQVAGPPFSILPDEVRGYWPGLVKTSECEDIDNAPPKFRAAGLQHMAEVVWLSEQA